MHRLSLIAGLVGSALVVSLAHAQEPQPTTPSAPPAPAATPSCSGLGCLFSSQPSAPPPPPPAPQAAVAPPADQPASAPVAAEDDAVTTAPRPRPVRAVTIAVEPAEMERLRSLAATMPRGKVKLVKDPARANDADFSVETSLDARGDGEKAKLFTEQMHIVAADKIRAVADLKDKVVSFGPAKSPGAEAARKAFEALNLSVKETPLDLDNALDGLATGDVAAVVVVAPQPVERLAKLSGAGLHLVAWPRDGALPAGAVASSIDAGRYPGLAQPDASIRAVGVDAVLRISAKGARRPESRSFLSALGQRSSTLSKRGFDLIKADLESRTGRRFASDEAR